MTVLDGTAFSILKTTHSLQVKKSRAVCGACLAFEDHLRRVLHTFQRICCRNINKGKLRTRKHVGITSHDFGFDTVLLLLISCFQQV